MRIPRKRRRTQSASNTNVPSVPTPPIFVTRPFLPPIEEFTPYLERIWASRWLTNNGEYHRQLEQEVAEYLGVKHLSLFANGTLALVTALQALRISGEVITTPYSFVATAHSLVWNNIQPVFVDIEPDSMNLDPAKVEAAITPRTAAILAVHCYGNPCAVGDIQAIADRYGLKVVYDAAHAFGVRLGRNSILEFGDMSVLSFHATKVYTTMEGGAIVCSDAKTKARIDFLKNFGIADENTVVALGINGKMNELQAAFGLLQLRHVDEAILRRGRVDRRYREYLGTVAGVTMPKLQKSVTPNYSYFPILVGEDYPLSRDELYSRMRESGIFARRYFYPLISGMPMYRGLPSAAPGNLEVAESVARRILCLPVYPDLTESEQDRVIDRIARK